MWADRLRIREKLDKTLDRTFPLNDTSDTSSWVDKKEQGFCSTVSKYLPENLQPAQFPLLIQRFHAVEQTFHNQVGSFQNESRAAVFQNLAEINRSVAEFMIQKFEEYNNVMLQYSKVCGQQGNSHNFDKIRSSHESKNQDFHKMLAKPTESRVRNLKRNRKPALLPDVAEEIDQTVHQPTPAQDGLVEIYDDLENMGYLGRQTEPLAIQDNCISLDKAKKPRKQCKPHTIQAKPTAVNEAVMEYSNVEPDGTFCVPKTTVKNNSRKGSKSRAPQANHHALEETITGHSDKEEDNSHHLPRLAHASKKNVSSKKAGNRLIKKQKKTMKSRKLSTAQNTSNSDIDLMDSSCIVVKLKDEDIARLSRPKRSIKKPGKYWLYN